MSGSGSKLTALTRHLSTQWHQTKDYWLDAKSKEFERKYIDELLASVDRAITVMDQVDKLTAKIRKDCE